MKVLVALNDRTPVSLTVNSYIFEVLTHGCPMFIYVYDRVKKVVVEQLGVKESKVYPDSHFVRDLGMD